LLWANRIFGKPAEQLWLIRMMSAPPRRSPEERSG
jgi:hypothetical protein